MRQFPRRATRHAPSSVIHQRGMSLVELMVAMTIGLFLVGAVAAIYVATANGSRASTLESQMNEDASLALEILQQQLRLAGYSDLDASGERRFRGVGVRGCDGGFSNNAASQDFDVMACGTASTASTDPDAFAVRYEATLLNTQPVTDPTNSVLQPTNCSFTGISAWDIGGGVSIPLADNRYYIAADSSNDDVPTLFCKGKNGSGFAAAAALIPNIEDMQITYAVTNVPEKDKPLPHQITSYVEAQDGVLTPLPAKWAPEDWARVAGVRICLLARTSRPVPIGSGSRAELGSYVDCKGERQDGNGDGFFRRAFHTTVQLRNMRPAVPAAYAQDGTTVRNPWAHLAEGG